MKVILLRCALVVLLFAGCGVEVFAQGQLYGTTMRGGSGGLGTIVQTNADPSSYYEVVYEWAPDFAGAIPQSTVFVGANGNLFGVSTAGGTYNRGVIYEFRFGGAGYKVWYNFSPTEGNTPYGGLVQTANGKFYGTTSQGGSTSNGTLFEFDPSTGTVTHKVDFNANTGSSPRGSMILVSGKLYGLNSGGGSGGGGTLFEYDPATNTYAVKANLGGASGSGPLGGLFQASNGKLYGATERGGVNNVGALFEYNIATQAYTKVFDFASATGAYPSGTLVQADDGKLYGFCSGGGANSGGVLYDFNLTNATYTLRASFQENANGNRPFGGLTKASNGKLYGITLLAPPANIAQIIQFDPATGTITARLGSSLPNGAGTNNYSSMIFSSNALYGVTPAGGEMGQGVLFSYNPLTDNHSIIVDFGYASGGAFPYSGMTLANNGRMYGMVSSGGTGKKGLLYEFDPVTKGYAKKVDFTGTNGANPLGELALAANGKLYGTTAFGGTTPTSNYFRIEDGTFALRLGSGSGVLFEYDPTTNSYTKKADFTVATGSNPYGKLLLASDGNFYGTTNNGGANNGGTIFKYVPGTGALTKIADLPSVIGMVVPGPRSGLVEAPNGNFYGVAPYADAVSGGGLVYTYRPLTSEFVVLKKFPAYTSVAPNEGNIPFGQLTLTADGMLYGLNTMGGTTSFYGGSVFRVNPTNDQVDVRLALGAETGAVAMGSLAPDQAGKLYALANFGPHGMGGTIFQYDPVANKVTLKTELTKPNGDLPAYSSLALYPGKMQQRIVLNEFTPVKFGTALTLPDKSTAGLPITYTSSNPAVATVNGNVVTLVSVGSTNITAKSGSTTSYDAAPDVVRALTVIKGDQTVTIVPISDQKMTPASFPAFAVASSGLAPVLTSSDPTIVSVTGQLLTFLKVGTVTITASQPGNNLYNAATPSSTTFSVLKGDQVINFTGIGPATLGQSPFTLTATISSLQPITYTSSNTAVATVSGNQVTIVSAGSTDITASQAGNDNYQPAVSVTRTLVVNKKSQSISGFDLGIRFESIPVFQLSATASSGLPVQYSTTSDKITISGSTITIVKPGLASMDADQAGNAEYAPAPKLTQTFCITAKQPTVTLTNKNSDQFTLSATGTAGHQWFLNDVRIPGAMSPTYQPTQAGVYKVRLVIDGCEGDFSADVPVVVTGLEGADILSSVQVYPNPANQFVRIELPNHTQPAAVRVIRLDGKVMETIQTGETMVDVNVSHYIPAVYLVRIECNGTSAVKKFVKE